MQSKIIMISNEKETIADIMETTDEFIYESDISDKKALHIRLLSEEVVAMVGAMVGDFSAKFWLEGDDNECRINLDATTAVDSGKRRELLSVSSSGKNTASRGIMAKIGEFIEDCIYDYDSVMKETGFSYVTYDYLYSAGMPSEASMNSGFNTVWSLNAYRKSVMESEEQSEESDDMDLIKDELEKSIVANIADEVVVGINKDKVKLTIIKKI